MYINNCFNFNDSAAMFLPFPEVIIGRIMHFVMF